MGKRIIPQKRGRGGSQYKAYGNRFAGKTAYRFFKKEDSAFGVVKKILHSKGHTAPLLEVELDNGKKTLMPAHISSFVGQQIEINHKDKVLREDIKKGNAYTLKNIPEGTQVYNIEITPGDNGKLVKAGGTFATIVSHIGKKTKILLPSKKEKLLNSDCRATIGVIGGGGRLDKPFLKAGNKFHWMKKKNKLYPRVSGVAMSAYNHPHGGTRSLRKGRPTVAPNNAPPGRKVGMLRPRHTGRNK